MFNGSLIQLVFGKSPNIYDENVINVKMDERQFRASNTPAKRAKMAAKMNESYFGLSNTCWPGQSARRKHPVLTWVGKDAKQIRIMRENGKEANKGRNER